MARMLDSTTGTLAAASQTVSTGVTTADEVGISIKGTWAGTIAFEASIDDGTNWFSYALVAASSTALTTGVVSASANGLFLRGAPIGPLTHIRANMTVWTSGTANIVITKKMTA